jgi:spore germination cell wall hydrolase CwlJ-like protein
MSNIVPPDALAIITLWQESQGEIYAGKVAVGEVIRERMRRNYSSDGSVAGTVCRRFQFSGWNGDAIARTLLIKSMKIDNADPVVQECVRAWHESRHTNYAKGAVLYCHLDVLPERPAWATPDKFLVKIDHHSFFSD